MILKRESLVCIELYLEILQNVRQVFYKAEIVVLRDYLMNSQ